ncbi:MAG: glycosyltransferase [bacterium]|nr:glycosyltransferase [bacterium]MDZ4285595.1 glycosyltransferase [Candidatus Sungbacteria bacterium]
MELSIIIPAYNEEKRLPPTLERILAHMSKTYAGSYEIIVMDDGSVDGTSQSVEPFIKKYPNVRLIRRAQNKGRGVTVREGVGIANGDIVLETDADGSVDEEAIPRFVEYLKSHPQVDMLIGSRNIEGSRILKSQPMIRTVLGHIFFMLAYVLFGWDFRDRVNGFKMFRRAVANDIFPHQREIGFLGEAEVVVIAEQRKWKYELLPVSWSDHRDSRIRPLKESWRSFWGMIDIVRRRNKGVYDKNVS